MNAQPKPPEFSEILADPQFKALDAPGKVNALRTARQVWRRHLSEIGQLDVGQEVVDEHARAAAQEAGVELEPGFFTGLAQDARKGLNQVRLGHNTTMGDDAGDINAIARYEAEHPGSLAAEDLASDMSDGTGLFDAIRKNPAGFVSTTVHGAANSVPGSLYSAGAGVAAGAGTGAITANPAAALGASATAAGATSWQMERGGRYLRKLQEAGAPAGADEDGKALERWLADNRELADRLKSEAGAEAAPTALLDAASAAIPAAGLGARAGRAVKGAVATQALEEGGIHAAKAALRGRLTRLGAKAAEYGVEQGMQGVLGAAGSAGSDLVAGDEVDTMGALQEGLGEFISPLELLGPAGKLGRRLVPGATGKTAASPVKTEKPTGATTSATTEPSPSPAKPAADLQPETEDLLGRREIADKLEAAAEAKGRADKLAALRSDYLGRWSDALQQRADAVREGGGEGDAWLSAVDRELTRIRGEQSGERRGAGMEDIRRLLDRVLPDADTDVRDVMALELHGADAVSSKANLDAALAAVRKERARAYELDEPTRRARTAAEAEELERRAQKAEADKANRARQEREHAEEIARLDAAGLTPAGDLDLSRWNDDDLAALAHDDARADHPAPKTFRTRLAHLETEAQRLQDANPDTVEAPPGAKLETLRAEAAKAFEQRMLERESSQDRGESLRDQLLRGRIHLPTESSIYKGELAALKEHLGKGESLKVFRTVADGEAGDRMLERLVQRLTTDEGHSYLDNSSAELLDALRRSADGEHLYPDWNNEDVRYSRQATLDLGAQGVGYELPRTIRNLTPRWNDRTLVFRSSLDKAVYYATSGEPSAHRTSVFDHIVESTGAGRGVIAAMGRALRERIAAEAARSGESVIVPETSPRILLDRDGVLYSRAGIDSPPRPDTLQSHDAQALQDAAHATDTFRKLGELGPEESLVPVELRKGGGSREFADQVAGSRAIAKKFGHRVVLFRAPEGFPGDGFVLRDRPGIIFLNESASRPVLAVTGHELMHSMESTAPRLAAAVREALADYRRHYHVYEAFSMRDGYRAEQVGREFAADVLGDTLLRRTFLDRLAAKAPRVFAEFLRFARRFIASVKARLAAVAPREGTKTPPGYGTSNFLHHLDAVDEMLARALVKWRARLLSGKIGSDDIGVRNLEDPALRPFEYPKNKDSSTEPEQEPVLMSRKPGNAGEIRPGDRFASVKKFIPKSEEFPAYTESGAEESDAIRATVEFLKKNPVVTDPDGRRILLANPERGSLENRARHLVASRDPGEIASRDRSFSRDKAATVPAVVRTIEDYQVRAANNRERTTLYFKRYADGTLHMAVVDEGGRLTRYGQVDGALITQYTPKPDARFEGVVVLAVREPRRIKDTAFSDEVRRDADSPHVRSPELERQPAPRSEGRTQPSQDSVGSQDDEISFSRRVRARKPLSVEDAEAALAAAKAERDKLPNNPNDVRRRRAEAGVTQARRALTEARSRAVTPEPLPLAESERDAATRRLAEAQANLSALQAAGKKVGGESYKDTPAYRKALAERDAAFAAITELGKGAPTSGADRLAELSAEREKLFRELNEGQLADDERTEKQARLAELNRTVREAERRGATEKTDWAPEQFDAARWAGRILDARSPGDIPSADHFAALSDNRLGELIMALKDNRDADNSTRVDTVTANLESLLRDRHRRGAAPSPSPVTREEKDRQEQEAKQVLAEQDAAKARRARQEQQRRDMSGGLDDWARDLGSTASPVPDDEPIPTDAAARTATRETPPDEVSVGPLSPEDEEALRAIDSIVPATTQTEHPLDAQARDADRENAEREEAARSGTGEPPAKTPPRDGNGEYAPRENGPASRVYGATTAVRPAWRGVLGGLADWFAGFRNILPEVPSNAWHLKGLVEGYKALARGQEVAVYNAEKAVARILEPILALPAPVDAASRKRLHALRTEQMKLDAELRDAATKPNFLERQKALTARIAELHKRAKSEADAMADQPLAIFENFILWRDLMHRAMTLQNSQGEPIALPYGVNVAEATEQAELWAQRLRESPHRAALLEAVKRHGETVTATWEDFKKRSLPIEGVWNGGAAYFPHIHPEHSTGRPDRVGRTAARDFRAYLTNPVGSTKPIETDYAKAMFLHLAAVEANNLHQDVVRNQFAPLDQTKELEAERDALRAAKKDVPSLEAMARHKGLVEYSPDDGMRFALLPTIDREKLGRAIGRVLDDSPLAEQLERLAGEGIRVRPEMITEQLALMGKDVWWVEPAAAEALRAIERQEAPEKNNQLARAAEFVNRYWKRYVLFFPHNYLRYEFNNTTSDTGKLWAADPEALNGVPSAFKEVRAFFRGEPVHADTAAAFRNGVFDVPTAKEVEDLRDVPAFDEKLHTDGEKLMRRILGWAGKDWHKFSAYREATYRLAKFNADLRRLRAGETPRYAGAYWRDIETIGESHPGAGDRAERRAAAISLATMNDYAAISRTGAQLRRYMVPFWSFTENNLRYHINLMRNLWDMSARGELTRAEAANMGAKATASLTARAALAIGTRVAFPLLALALWNAGVGGDDELSDEDRRRLHMNLGRDKDGRMRVLYLENDFVAFLRWFGGNRALSNALAVAKGDTDLATAAKDWATSVPADFAQTAFSVGPVPRSIALAAFDREVGMDILNPRTVHGKDKVWALVKEAVGIVPADILRSALDKDYYSNASLGDWLTQVVAQIRRRDPEQWAYYAMRERADEFKEAQTGRATDKGWSASPDTVALRSFRRAIYKGDIPAALDFYDRLLAYGYTSERLQASLRAADPLANLPKSGPGNRQQFIATLDKADRRDLDRAYLYAERFRALDGRAKGLFPKGSDNPEVMAARLDAFAKNKARRDLLRSTLQAQAEQDAEERRRDADINRRKSLSPAR